MRLFVGIDLPPDVLGALASHVGAQRRTLPDAKWVGVEALHLTLCFIGETQEAAMPRLDRCLSRAVRGQSRFHIGLASAGCFPKGKGAIRILWVGVEAPEPVVDLQHRVSTSLVDEGLMSPDERPFHPHVSIARCKRSWARSAGKRWEASLVGPVGSEFAVDEVVLFRSRLEPGGARYDRLRRFGFGESR